MKILKGIPASPGVAVGKAYVYAKEFTIVERKVKKSEVKVNSKNLE